jgi:hypothetical protein
VLSDDACGFIATVVNWTRLGNYYSRKRVKIKNCQFYRTAMLKRVCIALKMSDSTVGATLEEFALCVCVISFRFSWNLGLTNRKLMLYEILPQV